MNQTLPLIAADKIPIGESAEVVADGSIYAVFNVDGTFHVLDGICPHAGGPLGKGMLHGCVVTCPWHGWQFDVTTGQHRYSANVRQQTYEVKVESGRVFVRKDNSDAVTRGGHSE